MKIDADKLILHLEALEQDSREGLIRYLYNNGHEGYQKAIVDMRRIINRETEQSEVCPECEGDGIGRCDNPDHGFINAVGGEIGRLGCPICGHDPEHKINEPCESCNGTGKKPENSYVLDVLDEIIDTLDGSQESMLVIEDQEEQEHNLDYHEHEWLMEFLQQIRRRVKGGE